MHPCRITCTGLLVLLLTACGDPAPRNESAGHEKPGSAADNTPTPTSGNANSTAPVVAQPTANYHSDPTITARQLGIPLYPNASVLSAGTWDLRDPEKGTESLTSLKLESADPITKVSAYYKEHLTEAQFIEIDRPGGKRVSITLSLPDKTTTSAVLRETGSGTAIEITKLGQEETVPAKQE